MRELNRIINRAAHSLRSVLATGSLAGLLAASVMAADVKPAAPGKPAIEPRADALLKRMGDYLAQARSFAVSAEIWQDFRLGSGQQVQAGRTVELQVRRPDRLHAEVRSTRRNRGIYYDGRSITLLNRVQNLYGTISVPGSLDEALETARERFGLAMPLEDLIASDPYRNAIGNVTSGIDVGPVTVLGVACEHLVFARGPVDWQIWIEAGAKPVPRKIVITYKDEGGSPQYTAIFSNWDFETRLPDFLFAFEVPAGAAKIDVAQIKSENQAHEKGSK